MRFIHDRERSTGLVLPLLSIRTGERACGEFPDIAALAGLAQVWNMNLIQLLPVNDSGWQASPYSALSSIALNPIYLRIEDLPELASSVPPTEVKARSAILEASASLGKEFSRTRRVPYNKVLDGKMRILSDVWKEASGSNAIHAELEAWSRENVWVRPYACFMELKKRSGGLPWWEWPEYGTVNDGEIDALWSDALLGSNLCFWAWLQMRAQQQFAKACGQALSLGIDIMGDIPILMNRDSVDAWYDRAIFDFDSVAGSPPDAGAPAGQNWGFPLYRWDVIRRSGWDFWKKRLAAADAFYTSYRIDHVLGFFRIWAIGRYEGDGFLGHFEPDCAITMEDLHNLGFDKERVRWLSRPHVPEWAVDSMLAAIPAHFRAGLKAALFSQIGSEPLYLFSPAVRGSADFDAIVAGSMPPAGGMDASEAAITQAAATGLIDSLTLWWRNRTLLEISPGKFVPTSDCWSTQAWASLSDIEKGALGALVDQRRQASNSLWLQNGRAILSAITGSVSMQPCAEDLGFLSPGIPEVLTDLHIPGLRVLRWTRHYEQPGAPFVPLGAYPGESVACSSVHDSATMRQWWSEEQDRDKLWAMLLESDPAIDRDAAPGKSGFGALQRKAPEDLDPDSALFILKSFARVNSRIVVYPIQDLLAADAAYREESPQDERINIPATCDDFNWTYRMKPSIAHLLADKGFAERIATIGQIHGAAVV
ncbi:MAG: 4-alpha-glucanotransferase [Spirochaetaceae bacterium]|nr:4-alpha-glucanotransferase [Spirochaetaceae bacterium]